MDALEFLKEKKRMCDSYNETKSRYCWSCPMSSDNNGMRVSCSELSRSYPEEAIRIVEEWSKANPVKTNLTHYAEVMKKEFGMVGSENIDPVLLCPPLRFFRDIKCVETTCDNCRKWWNEEYKAPNEECKAAEEDEKGE